MTTRPATLAIIGPLALLALVAATRATAAAAQQTTTKQPTAKASAPAAGQPSQSTAKAPAAKQPAATKPSAKQPATAKPAPAKKPVDPADAAKKAEILNSYRWHRAIFEMSEWLSAQPFYNKQQVEQIKAEFNQQVADMSSVELSFMLDDMDEKFKIMESKDAKEARNWVGGYLSMLTAKKREQVLKDTPNILTMTAAQLEQEIMKIDRRRNSLRSNQAAFDRTRQLAVDNQLQQDRFEQETYVQNRNAFPTETYSPYRNAPARSIDSLRPPKQSMGVYVGAYGGFGLTYNPSSW